jgi:DNA mismatch repair ATPase MutS
MGGAGETFHLADAYAPELKAAREKLSAVGAELARIREEKIRAIFKTYDLDFTRREFLVVEETRASRAYSSPDLFFEAYDSVNVIAKPVFGPAYLELTAAKEKLHSDERAAEQKILRELSTLIRKEKNNIADYLKAVERADILLAKARLALEYSMARPKLRKFPAPPGMKKARFIPLETKLKTLKLKYTPLTFRFSKRVNILHGSNMGGKTVALKTLAFTQLLAQTGFFVPAQEYETCVYEKIHIVGDDETGRAEGLSSFGLEMSAFVRAYADTGRPCLVLMDEFAKTTNSDEAAAILSAISGDFCENEKVTAFIATHFSRLEPQKNAAFLKMKGFDNAAYSAYFSGKTPVELAEKLKMLNKFMAYEISANIGHDGIHDAIKIARILGVNDRIIERAGNFMAAQAAGKEQCK